MVCEGVGCVGMDIGVCVDGSGLGLGGGGVGCVVWVVWGGWVRVWGVVV